jgi:hypothetical protein
MRLPAGLLGMVALVALVEWGIARRELDVTTPATLSWGLSDAEARGEARSARVLVLGESLMKHGLLPEALESAGAGRTVNLAACAAQASTTYFLLKHALDSGARPGAIVVGFAPDLLTGDPAYNLRNWPELLTVPEALDLARTSRDSRLFAEILAARVLRSYRARHEIRAWIAGAIEGVDVSQRPLNELFTHHWTLHRGGQYTPTNPNYHGELPEAELSGLLADKFWCNKINRAYVDRTIALAESRGIRVFWLLPPVTPGLQARRDASGAEAKYEAFIRGIQARHPRLVVLDGRRSGYDWPVFQDVRHLVADGTLSLSADVAAAVANGAPTGGWVALPPFRPRPHDDRLEDVNGSRVVLEARKSSRR